MASLPAPWVERADEEGNVYYENEKTGETSWEPPVMAEEEESAESSEEVIERLQKELTRLQRDQAKSEKNSKKGNMKEAALKADIAKMKTEVRQSKKEAVQAQREKEEGIAKVREELARNSMYAEEQLLRNVTTSASVFLAVYHAIKQRDPTKVEQMTNPLTLHERTETQQVAIETVTLVKTNHDELTAQVASLERKLERKETELKTEKAERKEDNDQWKATVADLEEKEANLSYMIEQLNDDIEELNTQLEEEKANFELELARQREEDQNTISVLTAEREFAKERREIDLRRVASMWPDDHSPPTVLYPFVIEVRKDHEATVKLAAEAEAFKVGGRVMCWEASYNEYYAGTITDKRTTAGQETFEIRWHDGGEAPPVWVTRDYLHPLVEEGDKVVSTSVQTNLCLYDVIPPEPSLSRSARGRLDAGMEEFDARERVQREIAVHKAYASSLRASLEETAKKLFKMLDTKNNGELYYKEASSRMYNSKEVRTYIHEHPALEPILRENYLFDSWREVENDLTVPLVWREFREVCVKALMGSRGVGEANSDSEDSKFEASLNENEEPQPNLLGLLSLKESTANREAEELFSTTHEVEQQVLDSQREELNWLHAQELEATSRFAEHEARLRMHAAESEQLQHMEAECVRAVQCVVRDIRGEFSKVEKLCTITDHDTSTLSKADVPEPLSNCSRYANKLCQGVLEIVRNGYAGVAAQTEQTKEKIQGLDEDERDSKTPALEQELAASQQSCTVLREAVQGLESAESKLVNLQKSTVASLEARMALDTPEENSEDLLLVEQELANIKAQFEKTDVFCSQQSDCIKVCREVREKLVREEQRCVASIHALLDQKEAALARKEAAHVAQTIAANEIERTRADEHVSIVEQQLSATLTYVEAQIEKEIDQYNAAVAHRRVVAEEHLVRAKSMLAARDMKKQLRDLLEAEKESIVHADLDESWLKSHIHQMSVLEARVNEREAQWLSQNAKTIHGLSGSWLGQAERLRFEEEINVLTRAKEEVKEACAAKLRQMSKEVEQMRGKCATIEKRKLGSEQALTHELEVLSSTFTTSTQYLHSELGTYKLNYLEEKRLSMERMRATEEDCTARVLQLRLRMIQLQEIADSRLRLVSTMREDLRRKEEEAVKAAEERRLGEIRHTRQIGSLNDRLKAMTDHAKRLDNWIESLKEEVRHLNYVRSQEAEEMRRRVKAFEKKIRQHKLETWERDETARHLGTNVDFTFSFFTQALVRMIGSCKEYNDRLRVNGGVEVLVALLRSERVDIQEMAMESLCKASWDGHKDFRVISREAVDNWRQWVERIRIVSPLKSPDEKVEQLLQGIDLASATFTVVPSQKQTDLKVVEETEVSAIVGANKLNQDRIVPNSGDVLLEKAQSSNPVVRLYSVRTVAALALVPESKRCLGNISGCMGVLTKLAANGAASFVEDEETHEDMDFVDTAETQRYALTALANLLYVDEENQRRFGDSGGVQLLVQLASTSQDMDVLDSCSAALANCASRHLPNARLLARAGALPVLIRLCSTSRASEDLDQVCDRVRANAAETIVNLTKNDSLDNVKSIAALGLEPLVHLCCSPSECVTRVAGLVLGNIAQNDANRAAVGNAGGVEALFLLTETSDEETRINATWALASLAWNSQNQNRIGKQLPALLRLCSDALLVIREHATAALANALFYHEGNRRRVGFYHEATSAMVRLLVDEEQSSKLHENVLRAIGTASFNQTVALQFGLLQVIPTVVKRSQASHAGCQRFGAFALGNLAVLDSNKRKVVEANGVEVLTWLCGNDCAETVKYAKDALEILADLSSTEELDKLKGAHGLQSTLDLCLGQSEEDVHGNIHPPQPSVQALACESLVAHGNFEAIVDAKGLEVLIEVLQKSTETSGEEVLPEVKKLQQSCLGAMRCICVEYQLARSMLGRNGVFTPLLQALSFELRPTRLFKFGDNVAEAALCLLFTLLKEHEDNCRRLIECGGIDLLVDIAQAKPPSSSTSERPETEPDQYLASTAANNSQLALDVLAVIGPYSYIICKNCKAREKGGTTCSRCGRSILIKPHREAEKLSTTAV